MQFKKVAQSGSEVYLVRLEKGEELVQALKDFCAREQIKVGQISGIGASDRFQVGLFNTQTKKYQAQEFDFPAEMTALNGNVSTMNSEIYLHLHANFADGEYRTYGGHLNHAYISATAEIVIMALSAQTERVFDEEVGLNLWKLD